MYLGHDEPEPGTPEFGAMAAARRAALLGQSPAASQAAASDYAAALDVPVPGSPSFIGPVLPSGAPEPGSPAFGQRAATRKVTIQMTPLPSTSGPPLLYLPAKYAAASVESAAGALGKGLFAGVGPVVLAVGAGLALYFLLGRSSRG